MAELNPRIVAKLKQIPDVAVEAARIAMEQGAQEIVDAMKSAAPILKSPDKRRRAGALRDSIGWTWGDVPAGSLTITEIRSGRNKGDQYATMRIKIYAGNREAFYARWQEFGTTEHRAQPFFFPVWKARKSAFRARIRKEVRAAIIKAFYAP